ncbi:hypothetical protein P4O66_019284, partial [Electrophorus voltai]
PIVRCSKLLLKQVRTWPAGAISALQDCFEQTTWITFKEAASDGGTVNLEEYTTSVTVYISKCIDDVTVFKTIITRPNQKPWMPAEVHMLLRTRDSAFRTGDKEVLRKTRAKLTCDQGSKACTRTEDPWTLQRHCDAILPDALNDFYARFEAQNNVSAEKSIPSQNDQVLCLTVADVRECADQLADVLTDIFSISLSCTIVPTCFKTTTIIPVPKKSMESCLNDYRPIALTSIIMKCFERFVMRHVKTQLLPSLDPLQFAYCSNRSTDDAISTTLHLALIHLDKKGNYIRMLFSSALNTIVSQHLIGKLSLLGLNTSLCNWILDFLAGRPQSVQIGSSTSNTTTLSTGAPQGSVLSPLLFTLLTHDCAAMHSSNYIIKFTHDTTMVGLINKDGESAYREEVRELNIKFLGVHLAENLTWTLNISSITKRAQQRLYFLWKLREAHLPSPIPITFYRGTVESILSSCIITWFGNCTAFDRKTLQRIVRTAEKITGVSLPSTTDIYTTRCIWKAANIVKDPTHPSHELFTLLPSGR